MVGSDIKLQTECLKMHSIKCPSWQRTQQCATLNRSVQNDVVGPWNTSVTSQIPMKNLKLQWWPSAKRNTVVCWKMCASSTMLSLKFPLQDSSQQAASSTLPQFLTNWSVSTQMDLFNHPTFARNHLTSGSSLKKEEQVWAWKLTVNEWQEHRWDQRATSKRMLAPCQQKVLKEGIGCMPMETIWSPRRKRRERRQDWRATRRSVDWMDELTKSVSRGRQELLDRHKTSIWSMNKRRRWLELGSSMWSWICRRDDTWRRASIGLTSQWKLGAPGK